MKCEKEIKEHMIDCDYSRSNHFKMYNKFMNNFQKMEKAKNIITILLTVFYIIYFSFSITNKFYNLLVILLSVVLTGITIWMENANYCEKSKQHWLAAQSYQSLYRDCQFFNVEEVSLETNILVINRIRKHLSNLNLISPHIDFKINKETNKELKDKYKDNKTDIDRNKKIKNIKKILSRKLLNYKVIIYLYGSFLNKKNEVYKDIDIAIIAEGKDISIFKEIISIVSEIQVNFLMKYSEYINITLLSKDQFYSLPNLPYNINILNGKKIVDNSDNKKNKKYKINNESMYDKCQKFKKNAEKLISEENYGMALVSIYFAYYHSFIFILEQFKNNWKSESEMISVLALKIEEIPEFKNEDLKNYIVSGNLKNLYLYNYNYSITEKKEIAEEQLKYLKKYFKRVLDLEEKNK